MSSRRTEKSAKVTKWVYRLILVGRGVYQPDYPSLRNLTHTPKEEEEDRRPV